MLYKTIVRRRKRAALLALGAILLTAALVSAFSQKNDSVQATGGESEGATSPRVIVTREAAASPAPATLTVSADGKTAELGLEEYIVGVVAAEMPASYEPEALKAQAVAARTFAARRIRARGGSGCGATGADVCGSSAHCQAYCTDAGMRAKWGKSYDSYLSKLQAAVAATEGLIMTYDGEPIDALYHANSGGATEDVEHVFSRALPYLRGADSPEEPASASRRYTASQLAAALSEYIGAPLSADALRITVLSRYASGRVESVSVGGRTLTGKQLRSALSLPSSNFSITRSGDAYTIATSGSGHGVGMSQNGANVLAKDGRTFREILLFYYRGVEIERG